MKRRSREINIFSMSALDLFASALGAFILIAIVIFPYFPNASPRVVVPCPPVPAPPDPAPPVPCPPVPAAPVPAPPVPAPPVFTHSATQFPHLDLVIALDITGSMGDQIEGLKAEVDQLSQLLTRLTPSLAMGVVAFGDRVYTRPLTTFDLRTITGSPSNEAELRNFILSLETGMGGNADRNRDGPEAVLQALEAAVWMDWRPAAELRYIVLITDNPAYPEEEGAAISTAGLFAATESGNRVSTVMVGGSRERHVEGFLRRLAQAGGGQIVLDSGGSVTVTLLLSMI